MKKFLLLFVTMVMSVLGIYAQDLADGTDCTDFIVNPTFNDANGTGWTEVTGKCTNKSLNGGLSGFPVAESWHSVFNFQQTVTGVPDGIYEINLNGFCRLDNNQENVAACVYINDFEDKLMNINEDVVPNAETEDGVNCYLSAGSYKNNPLLSGSTELSGKELDTYLEETDSYRPNGRVGASIAFSADRYKATAYGLVEGGTLTIGVKNETDKQLWALWSNFKLTYRAQNQKAVESVFAKLKADAEAILNGEEANQLSEAVKSGLIAAKNASCSYDNLIALNKAIKRTKSTGAIVNIDNASFVAITNENHETVATVDGEQSLNPGQYKISSAYKDYMLAGVKINGEAVAPVQGAAYWLVELAKDDVLDITAKYEQENYSIRVNSLDAIKYVTTTKDGGKNITEEVWPAALDEEDNPIAYAWSAPAGYKVTITLNEGYETEDALSFYATKDVEITTKKSGAIVNIDNASLVKITNENYETIATVNGKQSLEPGKYIIGSTKEYMLAGVKINGEAKAPVEGANYWLVELAVGDKVEITANYKEEEEVCFISFNDVAAIKSVTYDKGKECEIMTGGEGETAFAHAAAPAGYKVTITLNEGYETEDALSFYATKNVEITTEDLITPVISLINAIGKVEYTPECKEKIAAARKAYDDLTEAQQAIVTNYQKLLNAESRFAGTLLNRVEAFEEAISQIPAGTGVFQYTPVNRDGIDYAVNKAENDLFSAGSPLKELRAYNDFVRATSVYTITLPKSNDFFTIQDKATGLYLNIEGENAVLSATPSILQFHATGEEPIANPDYYWVKSEYYIYSTASRKYLGVDGSDICLTTSALHPFQIAAQHTNEWIIGLEGEDQLGCDANKHIITGSTGMKWFIAYVAAPTVDGATPGSDDSAAEATSINKVDGAVKADGKYLENGRIVIVRNGRKYNANGSVVK